MKAKFNDKKINSKVNGPMKRVKDSKKIKNGKMSLKMKRTKQSNSKMKIRTNKSKRKEREKLKHINSWYPQ